MKSPISVKVSKKNQIAVPAVARQLLNIIPGDRLLVDIQDGIIILIPNPRNYTTTLEGLHHEIWEDIDANAYISGERVAWTDLPKE